MTKLCSSSDQVADWKAEPATHRTDGSWQFLQVHRGDPSAVEWLADHLSAETGAPALAIYVQDSDCGYLVAASPTGVGWHGYLDADSAMTGYDMPPLDATTEQIAEAAVGWAVEAGRVADAEAITAALAKRPGPFGEGVADLMSALGFHFFGQ